MELPKDPVKLASRCKLQDQEDTGGVVEPGKEPEDVGVVQPVLDLDLSSEVSVKSVLLQFLLKDHLQSYHIPTLTAEIKEEEIK